jgi:hypothetical protein
VEQAAQNCELMLVVINPGPAELDCVAHALLHGVSAELLPRLFSEDR